MIRALLAGLLMGAALAVPASAQAPGNQGVYVENHQLRPASVNLNAVSTWIPPEPIVQDYEPDPAVWLLEDEDTRIYLLGTFHILPAGFRWRSPRIDGIVTEADELVVESADEEAGEGPWLEALFQSMEERPSVSERLSPGSGAKWLAMGATSGLPAEAFDKLPPLMALFMLGISFSDAAGSESAYGVETVLEAEFEKAGKPVGHLESGVEVMKSMLALDEEVLIREIDLELSGAGAEGTSTFWTEVPAAQEAAAVDDLYRSEHNWAQGILEDGADFLPDTEYGRTLAKVMLDDRNRAWAGWLENRLATPGTVLVAVGAAHLEGRTSVQVMLSERGLAAERLN